MCTLKVIDCVWISVAGHKVDTPDVSRIVYGGDGGEARFDFPIKRTALRGRESATLFKRQTR